MGLILRGKAGNPCHSQRSGCWCWKPLSKKQSKARLKAKHSSLGLSGQA